MLSMRLMRFSPKIHQIGSINKFFLSLMKSPTQKGFDGVLNLEPNISCLGPFKHSETFSGYLVRMLKVSIVYSRRACNRSCVLCPAPLPPRIPTRISGHIPRQFLRSVAGVFCGQKKRPGQHKLEQIR